ncbi:recombinase family protein [Microbacterium sp.]|uniref:recombinase family protein n=1 Tax=Microbacterium sp. TaxID=51671 RepID=UPI003F9D02E7
MSKRAAIYARISQEDEHVPKVEIQTDHCVALAGENGAEVVKATWKVGSVEHSGQAYVDNGIPATGRSITDGTRHKRPAFDALVQGAERGEFDMIVATSGDRLARNYPDGMALVAACVEGGVVIVTEDEGLVDPRTPGGEERAMNLFVGGRREIRSRTAKQKRRYDAETAEGRPLWGRRTFGFAAKQEVNRHGRVTRRWVLHEPLEVEAIQWAAHYLLNDPESSIYGIVREFNRRELRPVTADYKPRRDGRMPKAEWSNASIRTLLMNPRIAGLVARDGVVQEGVKAAWEPIIPKTDYDAIVSKLSDKSRRTSPGPKTKSLGGGIVRCGCGAIMRSTTCNGKPGLRCDITRSQAAPDRSVKHQSIQSEFADPLIIRAVASAFLFGPSDVLPSDGMDLGPVEIELGKLRDERERLSRWVHEDLMPEGEAVPKLRAIRLREGVLHQEIEDARSNSAHTAMIDHAARSVLSGPRVSIEDASEARTALEERFKALPLELRRGLVRDLLDVQVLSGRGAGRVRIRHTKVVHLNDDYEDAI